jgi:hypothetical protein
LDAGAAAGLMGVVLVSRASVRRRAVRRVRGLRAGAGDGVMIRSTSNGRERAGASPAAAG